MHNSQFGIIQGRIFPEDKLRYNIFPSNWRHELILSKRIGYKYIEFLLDDKLSRKNPLVNKKISSLKKSMIKSKQKVHSVILTYFVNHNFFFFGSLSSARQQNPDEKYKALIWFFYKN